MKKLFIALILNGLHASSLLSAEDASSSKQPSELPSVHLKASEKSLDADKDGIVLFTPPSGWGLAQTDSLPVHVRAMVVGKGPSSFPPSMNLSWEPYKGTLKQYLKTVKNLNSAQGYEWKDLGNIRTEAGNASLSQVDTKSQWGDVRLMHVIFINSGNVYILTASALKDEFSIFYKDFFASMRSLRVAHDAYEMIPDQKQRLQLKIAADKLQMQLEKLLKQKENENPELLSEELKKNLFNSQEFQDGYWKPFQEMLKQKYGNFGAEWQTLFLKKLKEQLSSRSKTT